ncbi:MAG: hypothetical protein ACOYXR_13305 [Nitrospirota bacterium]
MPNGKGSPDCRICRYHERIEDTSFCKKHHLTLPYVTSEIICRDWEHKDRSSEFKNLQADILYYYSYASTEIPIPLYEFSELNIFRRVIFVPIKHDSELGWSLVPFGNESSYFPPPGERFAVVVSNDGATKTFEVAERRRLVAGPTEFLPDGTKSTAYDHKDVRRVFCPNEPDFLFQWFDSQFHTDAVVRRWSRAPLLFNGVFSYFVHIEIIPAVNRYRIFPNLLHYRPFKRGDYHPVSYTIKKWFSGQTWHWYHRWMLFRLRFWPPKSAKQ